MKSLQSLYALLLILLISSCSQPEKITIEERADQLSKNEMQSVMEFLGHDLLEGRAPGTRGGDLAEIYVQSLCKYMDLEPGNNNSYLQPFVMKGFSNTGVMAEANGIKLNYIDDIVGSFTTEKEHIDLTADVVFVGFGIKTDIWNWDDYKDVDVKNKLVITRVNDPGFYNPDIFEGKTLTYFGRWTYHIEEAARRGAAGILLIHTDETAGYDWNVVKNSWSGEELYIESELENNLQFRGWMKESSFDKLLLSKGLNKNELYEKTKTNDFQPVELGFQAHISGDNSFRNVLNNNVVAHIQGQTDERIVISAHLDHLGMNSGKEGENIYNGTIDNGSAVAAMMMVAKILKEHQNELYYSVTILGCNSEESGLLGSKYYAQNTNRSNIIANINLESTPVWSAAKSIMGIGARFSDFEEIITKLAQKDGLGYSQFSLSNQGLFYRSDQFSFARYGVPAVWISAGEDEITGERNYTEFWGKDYHTVRDDFNPEWELEGMRQTIKYALLLIEELNTTKASVKWKANLPFPME
ncbi:M28 family peptidase [Carboxylicivirga caseinilyticus]|uniref:M28 family peptidase n=1 Tax=Carboxylicivirga caseinilyticus TaxID=3417572 RepID=UPI003D356858|nr:M28 family peptidase [Marinilabiliaceae bacterium A049]